MILPILNIRNVFHLGLKQKDLHNATLAILPGDPNRVKKIALLLDAPKHLSSCREFISWSARIQEHTIIICSTGIGGSSTSIAVEELSQLGIRTFLRVGTAGAIQDYINVGDMIIITAAVRCDGASRNFAPLEFPATADLSCSTALIKAGENVGAKIHHGITVSTDTFYPGQERKDTYSKYIIKKLQGSLTEWQKMGVMSYEMESATLLTMCATQEKLRAGVITGIIINRTKTQEIPNKKIIQKTEDTAIKIVTEGARILLLQKEENLLHLF